MVCAIFNLLIIIMQLCIYVTSCELQSSYILSSILLLICNNRFILNNFLLRAFLLLFYSNIPHSWYGTMILSVSWIDNVNCYNSITGGNIIDNNMLLWSLYVAKLHWWQMKQQDVVQISTEGEHVKHKLMSLWRCIVTWML